MSCAVPHSITIFTSRSLPFSPLPFAVAPTIQIGREQIARLHPVREKRGERAARQHIGESGAATRSGACAGGKLAVTNECGELSAASWPRRTGPLALRAALRAGPRTAPASSITSQPRGKPVASNRPERTTQQRNAVATEKEARGDAKQAMPRRRCHAGDHTSRSNRPASRVGGGLARPRLCLSPPMWSEMRMPAVDDSCHVTFCGPRGPQFFSVDDRCHVTFCGPRGLQFFCVDDSYVKTISDPSYVKTISRHFLRASRPAIFFCR